MQKPIEWDFPHHRHPATRMLRRAVDRRQLEHDVSVRTIAREMGLSNTYLGQMASGRVPIPIDRAVQLADHLGLTNEFIWEVLAQRHPTMVEFRSRVS